MSGRCGRGNERGAVLVFVGLAMVALLGIVAIVVDLGQLRASRRGNQSAADLAALAAGYHLSGRGTDPLKPSPRAACAGAINSVQTNLSDFEPTLDAAARASRCIGFPDTTLGGCSPAPSPVVIDRGPYRLTLTYPVPDSVIKETRFKNGVGATDGSNPCERLAVQLRRVDSSFFAGIFGVESREVSARTVVRANTSALIDGVAALLLLERMGCGVVMTAGGGGTGEGVVVRASSPTNPGVIQADSAGQVGSTLCKTTDTADGYVVFGTGLPNDGGPSIRVEPAPNGVEGIIAIRAIEVGGRGGYRFPDGIYPAPIGSGINSRQVVDNRYNRPVSAGGHAQISRLHSEGRVLVASLTAPAGYAATITGSKCRGLDTRTDTTFDAADKVFVQCDDFVPDFVVLPAATNVVFTGKVSIGNGGFLSLPAARRVYVRGCVVSCTGTGNHAIEVKGGGTPGELRINTLATGSAGDLACASRPGPGAEPPGTHLDWSVLATFAGPIISDGQMRLCQTAVYASKNEASYTRQSVEATGVGSPSYPAIAECTPTRPCPSDAGGDQFIQVGGGSGNIDWSAPNQITAPPTLADFANNPFEDLALWDEASSPSFIKGQGANRTEGVFFLPNARVTFQGQATQNQPLNAQFIARRLDISGQGSLFLRPSKDDAVPTRIPGAVGLIR